MNRFLIDGNHEANLCGIKGQSCKDKINVSYSELLRREFILLRESIRLVMQDPKKYTTLIGALCLSDIFGITSGIRSAYFFCRILDNMADGDREIIGGASNFPSLLSALHEQIDSTSIDVTTPSSVLLHDAMHRLGEGGNRKEVAKEFHTFLDTTLIDFQRRNEHRVFSEEELRAHYMLSFMPVQNLALIALQSRSRAEDLGLLWLLQGKAYAIRDIFHELPRGEINVPSEAVQQSGMDVQELMSHADILSIPSIGEWIKQECSASTELLKKVESLPQSDDGVRRILSVLLPPIRRFLFQKA